jgi:hypothetical protein
MWVIGSFGECLLLGREKLYVLSMEKLPLLVHERRSQITALGATRETNTDY